MKYGSRQSQQARSAAQGEPGKEGQATVRQGPAYRPETESAKGKASDSGETLPLLGHLEAETWLAERLKDHGYDIYAGGPYADYAERLGSAIVRNGIQCVILGRNPAGKPESYAQLFQRICGKPLPKAADVSRGTKSR